MRQLLLNVTALSPLLKENSQQYDRFMENLIHTIKQQTEIHFGTQLVKIEVTESQPPIVQEGMIPVAIQGYTADYDPKLEGDFELDFDPTNDEDYDDSSWWNQPSIIPKEVNPELDFSPPTCPDCVQAESGQCNECFLEEIGRKNETNCGCGPRETCHCCWVVKKGLD